MGYAEHMRGYSGLRTLYQVEALSALKEGRYYPPVLVEMDPTSRCNQSCIYCYSNQRVPRNLQLRDEVFIDCFRQFADAGVKAVLLQGTGEPLLHRALPAAVKVGADAGLTIALNSNGVLLKSRLQDEILQYLFYIKFSVLESDPQHYAFLHGCAATQWRVLFDNIAYAVRLRERHKLDVALWATLYLDEKNFNRAGENVSFLKDSGLDYVVIQEATYSCFTPTGKREYASARFSNEEIAEMKAEVASFNDENFRVKVVFPLINPNMNYAGQTRENFIPGFCQGPKLYMTVCADGEVYPCWRLWGRGPRYSYGSVYRSTFEEILRSEQRNMIDDYINTTPPEGDECLVCNHARLNEILFNFLKADSRWKDFVI